MKKSSKSSNKLQKYKKLPGFNDGSGPKFEEQMTALLFIRCLLKFNTVHLASNMQVAGKLDDIVVNVGDTPVFIQLKTRGGKYNTISESNLAQSKSDFCPLMYYQSYCEIKKSWNEDKELQATFPIDNAVFVVYTNAKFDAEISRKISTNLNEWQSTLNTEGKVISFCDKNFPEVFNLCEKMIITSDKSQSQKDKQYSEIDSELDDLNYKEFLSRFWLFADQASNEELLENLIKNDIGKLLPEDCLTDYYQQFRKGIKTWWSNREKCITPLTESNTFWVNIIDKCVSRLTSLTLEGQNPDFLQFNETELKIFEDHAGSITIIVSDCAKLTALKIHQSLKGKIPLMANISVLLKHKEQVLNLWKKLYDVLIVLLQNEAETCDVDVMLGVLESNAEKRLFLVGCVSQQIINHLESKTGILPRFTDHFKVTQLDSKSYEQVQRLTVNLQDHEVAINQFIPDICLSGDIVWQLSNEKAIVFGSCLKEMINYLVPRSLKRMDVVDNNIFCDSTDDYFVIGNTQELHTILPNGSKVCTYGQDEFSNHSHFIQVDEQFTMKDFGELCTDHSNTNFHWLNMSIDKKLVWQKSAKNLDLIICHLQSDTLYKVEDNIDNRLVIVVAEPGMGKTVLLSSVALHLKSLKPNAWVINVALNNHADYLSKENSTAVGLLELSAGIKDTFEKKIFHIVLNFTENVIVLLDGFDEISPGNSDKVLAFVQHLLSETKVCQLWLSSRPTMKDMLQSALDSLVFEIVPFSREEQKLFLEKFWNICDADNFIENLLDLLGNNTNDTLGKFTGIPLQLQMLAEVFGKDVEYYKTTGSHQLPNALDLLKLYKMFVKKKWEIYLVEKSRANLTNEAQKINYNTLEKMFIKRHEACALFTLLTREQFSHLPNADGMKALVEQQLEDQDEKEGIITGYINGQPLFIHRTFQEYFAASWLSQNFKKVPQLLETKILDSDLELVMKFFDRMLAQDCRLHVAVMDIDPILVESLMEEDSSLVNSTDEGGRSVLHAAVLSFNDKLHEDQQKFFCKVLDIILNTGIQLNKEDGVLHWTALRYADALKAWKVIGILLQKGADASDLISTNNLVLQIKNKKILSGYDVHPLVDALCIAILEGFFELLQYLISKGKLIDKTVMPKCIRWDVCTWDTALTLLQESCFRGRIDVAQLLLNMGATVDAYDAQYNMTALMWAAMGGHTEIITLLLQHGANCNAQSKYYQKLFQLSEGTAPPPDFVLAVTHYFQGVTSDNGHTALHLAAMFGNEEVVRVLLANGADVNVEDEYQQTPLQFAVQYGHLEVADHLLKHGAQVNKINRWGLTPLHVSVVKCHLSLTECLISHGADIHIFEMNKYTALHLAVICNEDAIECLLKHGSGIHSTDGRGNAPIHIAAVKGNLKVIKRLVNNGADIIHSNVRGHTPLHLATRNGHLELAEWLIQQGASVDCEDVDGCTPLHLTALTNHKTLETAQHLIEKGATLNKVNKNGKSPLHFAAICSNLDFITLMLKSGASVNQLDNEGITPLYESATDHSELAIILINGGLKHVNPSFNRALSSWKLRVTEYLINNGANINQGDIFNKSPLHVALENGHLNIAELLVKRGAVTNTASAEGQIPLHIATEMGHLDITQVLLTAGSCINQGNLHGTTALHLAVKHLKVMEYLASCGADLNQRDVNGCTALHCAAERGSLDVLRWLVASGLTLDSRSNNGQTPLHFALDGGNVQVIDWIIQKSTDADLTQDCIDGLLGYAACRGNVQLFHKMVNKNGNVKKKFMEGETILHIAALNNQLNIVMALKDLGLNMNQRCYDGRTPLHFAAQGGSLNVVEWLVQNGSKPMLRANDGTTALHLAARGGHIPVVEWLDKQGADLHDTTNDYQTVMHFAAQGGNLKMITWLKEKSVSVSLKSANGKSLIHFIAPVADIYIICNLTLLNVALNDKTTDESTVMHFAVQQKYSNCNSLIYFLWTAGFNTYDACSDGKTCTHFAAFADNVWWLQWSLEYHNINLEVSCADGRTPVHFAAQGGAINVLKLLKSKGCNLLLQSNDGRTALHFAVLGGNMSVIQWLLQEGIDVHQTTHDGRTALHFAAEGGHMGIFRWLIKQHLNVHQRSQEGVSVLHAAAKGGCLTAVKWLIRQGFDLKENSYDDRNLIHFAAEGGSLRVVQWLVKKGLDFQHKALNNTTPLHSAVKNVSLRVAKWFELIEQPNHYCIPMVIKAEVELETESSKTEKSNFWKVLPIPIFRSPDRKQWLKTEIRL